MPTARRFLPLVGVMALSCRHAVPVSQRGTWGVVEVAVDGVAESYGPYRAFVEVTDRSFRVFRCAYMNDWDHSYYRTTERACPVSSLNCVLETQILDVGQSVWRYNALTAVPSCTIPDPNVKPFGFRYGKGAECSIVSPMPIEWPYVGAGETRVVEIGDEMILEHAAGVERRARARIDLRRVPTLPLPSNGPCIRAEDLNIAP